MKQNTIRKYILIMFAVLLQASCDFVETASPPRNELTNDKVFSNDAGAVAAMEGIYAEIMVNNNSGFSNGSSGITLLTGLSGDEFFAVSPNNPFYENSLESTNTTIRNALWDLGYRYIYYSNAILEGLDQSQGVTKETREQLTGEAKFLRAFFHLHLAGLFGDIPIVTSTDYEVNSSVSRPEPGGVNMKIREDLEAAVSLVDENYSGFANQRVRVIRPAVQALLARLSLYTGNWIAAEEQATLVISNPLFGLESDLNRVFLVGSKEAILQFKPVVPGYNTWDGALFIPTSSHLPPNFGLSAALVNDFAAEDLRQPNWTSSIEINGIAYRYPYKYKIAMSESVTENLMVLRLTEQYLIRAEARARQGKLSDAIEDLDVIRERAGLEPVSATHPGIGQEELIQSILQERRLELFAEWGHRWYDLKRTGQVNEIMAVVKGDLWQSTDALYPIPQVEIGRNPLLEQNPGY